MAANSQQAGALHPGCETRKLTHTAAGTVATVAVIAADGGQVAQGRASVPLSILARHLEPPPECLDHAATARWRRAGSVRFGANVTSFGSSLRVLRETRQIMAVQSPDLSAYCYHRRFWREP
jgi:hypothetical protein